MESSQQTNTVTMSQSSATKQDGGLTILVLLIFVRSSQKSTLVTRVHSQMSHMVNGNVPMVIRKTQLQELFAHSIVKEETKSIMLLVSRTNIFYFYSNLELFEMNFQNAHPMVIGSSDMVVANASVNLVAIV